MASSPQRFTLYMFANNENEVRSGDRQVVPPASQRYHLFRGCTPETPDQIGNMSNRRKGGCMSQLQNRKRNNQFSVRLSDEELALWNKKQNASGLGKTEFFVKLLRSKKVQVYRFNDTIDLLYKELRRIGVNLNQLAYLANSGRLQEAVFGLNRMQEEYISVMDRLVMFLEKPLVNAHIIDEQNGGE